jgi:hypothetical protein
LPKLISENNNKLFNNTETFSRVFMHSEQELVYNFADKNRCDLVLINSTECQLIRYSVEYRDEDEDDLVVNRIVSKIILN